MIIAGIEEAGRGPVIGPMVMAICSIENDKEHLLKSIGVKDSKLLSKVKRSSILEEIKKVCKVDIQILSPFEIDNALNSSSLNLNLLEAKTSGNLIDRLSADKYILDLPSNNAKAYTDAVKGFCHRKNINILAEHKADFNYLIVGAASIVAKVVRDEEVEKLKKQIGIDFGSGYPSDPRTKSFLKKHYLSHSDIFRKTWKTYKKIENNSSQMKL